MVIRNRNRISVFVLLLALLLSLALLPSCSSSGGDTADNIVLLSEMAFATSVDTLGRPLDKKSYFPPETPKIYCCVKVSNAPSNTEIKADWIYIKGEDVTAENVLMDSRSVTVDGTRFVAFSFSYSRPSTLWVKGDYKVILSVNGVQKVQGPFVIR